MPPGRHVTVVACMDDRLDVYRLLGLEPGEAHGTIEIVLVHHSDCGVLTFKDDDSRTTTQGRRPRGDDLEDEVLADAGIRPPFAFEGSPTSAPTCAGRWPASTPAPFIPHKNVTGFVYEVDTGKRREAT